MAFNGPLDPHFGLFAQNVQRAIAKHGKQDERDVRQKQQMRLLMRLEKEFRTHLIDGPYGATIYMQFVVFICDEQRDILSARPYFRERQTVFTKYISGALKDRNIEALYPFNFNFEFASFVMRCRDWAPKSKIRRLYEEIKDVRQAMAEIDMPLAINRARVFYSRVSKSHLSYMDFIQIASKGFMNGLDKYSPGDGPIDPKVLRSTLLGRIGGEHIKENSETMIHFYPTDKRKLYRANKAVGRLAPDGVDFDHVAKQVNAGFDPKHLTSSIEIADLMAAGSCVSSDAPSHTDPDSVNIADRFAAPESSRPDLQAEERDAYGLMRKAMSGLSVYEVKLLRLKGIRL